MHHIHVHNEALTIGVEQHSNLVVVRLELTVEGQTSLRQSIELAVGVTFRVLQIFMGASWQPRLVCFTHPKPASLTVHRRLFGRAVEFGHQFNGIVCNAADLDVPNPGADAVMVRYAQRLLEQTLDTSSRMSDRVRQLVVLLLPRGLCRVEVVAQHLGIDRRTVARRLAEERDLVQRARQRPAARPLRALPEGRHALADRSVGAARLLGVERVLALASAAVRRRGTRTQVATDRDGPRQGQDKLIRW